jgi:galactokinase
MISKVATFDELVQTCIDKFREIYKCEPEIAVCAPGRVNLIGEHVDYCDGFVLPMALSMVTVIIGKSNGTESTVDITTLCDGINEIRQTQFDTKNLVPGKPKWANYIKGVIQNYGTNVKGFLAVVNTNVPVGGGLSSSAALEVSTLKFLEVLTSHVHPKLSDKALICQKAEHEFAGMPCGIMDQFISVMATKGHALLIDCQSLTTQQIPFSSKDLVVLICNSNVKHELSDSEYPTRRNQCNEALKIMGLKNYRQADLTNLTALENANPILQKRARHVISEIQRTQAAANALQNENFNLMGKLMTESHKSLSEDFEVSCRELDILTEIALKCDGVLGSRMTGGGFGGCTVTLCSADQIENLISTLDFQYTQQTNGLKASFYVCQPDDGARIIQLDKFISN